MDDDGSSELSAPNSKSWRERADRCRAAAQKFQSIVIRDRMLEVAAACDRMAAQAGMHELEHLERGKRRHAAD
jgi:hypothetical protein